MSTLLHIVDDRCKGDAICVDVCPKGVIEIRDGRAHTIEESAAHCLLCGQCVAVCPNEYLNVTGLDPADFVREQGEQPGFEAFLSLLRSRRSVRVFADKAVDRSLIDRVIEATATAPPAFPPHATEILVIDQRPDLDILARTLVESYDRLIGLFANPIGRLIIRLRRGAETYLALKNHVMQIVKWDNERYRSQGVDRYTYGAPVVLLFHSDRSVAGYAESAMVAATYAMLAAHSLGLGATMLSIVPPALNNIAVGLRRSYGIPDTNSIVIAMILGHRRYRYRRSIRRQLKSARFLSEASESGSFR